MWPAFTRSRGSQVSRWIGSLARAAVVAGSCACGSSSAPGMEAGPGGEGFEGENFYESMLDQAPPVPIPASVPGFYELVSGEEGISECVARAPDPDPPLTLDPALRCPEVRRGAIDDFDELSGAGASGTTFPPGGAWPGGTFFYPMGGSALSSDVSGRDWHLSGTVSEISGFGLYLSGCQQLDASSFRGVAFTLWGSIGAEGQLVFFVGTAENQVSHEWLNEHKSSPSDPNEPPNLGRCTPVSARYDGSCREPRLTLGVNEEPTQVSVLWPTLSEGCPADMVNPGEITAMAWYFPQSPDGPYPVDIHIDDLRFTNAGPL